MPGSYNPHLVPTEHTTSVNVNLDRDVVAEVHDWMAVYGEGSYRILPKTDRNGHWIDQQYVFTDANTALWFKMKFK